MMFAGLDVKETKRQKKAADRKQKEMVAKRAAAEKEREN